MFVIQSVTCFFVSQLLVTLVASTTRSDIYYLVQPLLYSPLPHQNPTHCPAWKKYNIWQLKTLSISNSVILKVFLSHKQQLPDGCRHFWSIKEYISIDDGLIVYGCRLLIYTHCFESKDLIGSSQLTPRVGVDKKACTLDSILASISKTLSCHASFAKTTSLVIPKNH